MVGKKFESGPSQHPPLGNPSHFRWGTVCYGVALVTAVVATYASCLHAPFIYDDSTCIADNPSIKELWPLVGNAQHPGPLNPPKNIPTFSRPLVNLTLALNYHFGKLNPVGYHFLNLVIHALSTLLLWAILKRILRLDYFAGKFATAANPLAFLIALLWALHPLQTETVVYVTQRTELLVALFYLTVLYCALRYWSANSIAQKYVWAVLALLSSLAGTACKEVMVTAPVVVLLFERTLISGSFKAAMRKSWPLYLGLLGSWLFLWILNSDAPRAGSAGFHLGLPAYVWWFTQAKVFWMYMKLVVWPWPLVIHYELPYLRSFSEAWPWLLMSILAGSAVLLMLWRRTALGLAGACVIMVLSPTMLVPILTEVAAERRMYLPLAALISSLLIGGYWLLERFANSNVHLNRTSNSRGPIVGITCIAILFGIVWSLLDINRVAAYHDAITLWQNTATIQPDNFMAHNNWAIALAAADRPQEAIDQFRIAPQIKPNEAESYSNLGFALMQSGAYNNLGNALRHTAQPPRAIEQYKMAVQIEPSYAGAHANLATTYARMSRPEEALAEGQTAIELARSQADIPLLQQMETWMSSYRASLSDKNNSNSNLDSLPSPSK